MTVQPAPLAERTAVARAREGSWSAAIDAPMMLPHGPNGGFVAAIALRAMTAELAEPERAPRSLTVHYLRAAAEGAVAVETVVERRGRTVATVTARLVQEGALQALAIGAFAHPSDGLAYDAMPAPALPEPDALAGRELPESVPVALPDWEFRPGLGPEPFAQSAPETGGWLRPSAGGPLDAPLTAAALDSWWPSLWGASDRFFAANTIDLTVHFRSPLPLAGEADGAWRAFRAATTVSRDGLLEEDAWLWSEGGVLVAQSRQLGLSRWPRA